MKKRDIGWKDILMWIMIIVALILWGVSFIKK